MVSHMTIVKTIRMTEVLLEKAQKRANDIGYTNLSEYIRSLIQEDLKR